MSADSVRQGVRDIASQTYATAGVLVLDDTRAVLGYNVIPPSKEFLLDLVTDGPYMLIMPATLASYDPHERYAHYNIKAYLWFGFDRNSNQDSKLFEKFLTNLKNKLIDFDTCATAGIDVTTKGPEWEPKMNPNIQPGVVLYTIRLTVGEGD